MLSHFVDMFLSFLSMKTLLVGFGTYAAVDIPAAGVLIASVVSAIPVFYSSSEYGRSWAIKDYVWEGPTFSSEIQEYIKGYDLSFACSLLGALTNCHTGIMNIVMGGGRYDPMLDRRVDAGAGASSAHVATGFYSLYPIAAGEEFFVSYGEWW